MRFRPWPQPTPRVERVEGCITCGAPCQPGRYFCPADEPTYTEVAS